MFGLGLWEVVAICLVALVFVRPEELPRVMRKLGRWYTRLSRSPRRMWQDFEATANAEAQHMKAGGEDQSISTTQTHDTEETHT